MSRFRSPFKNLSLTSRVLLFVSLSIGLSLLLSRMMVLNAIGHHFLEQDTQELNLIEQSILKSLNTPNTSVARLDDLLSKATSGHVGTLIEIRSPTGQLLFKSSSQSFLPEPANQWMAQKLDMQQNRVFEWEANHQVYRGKVAKANNGMTFAVALDMGFHLQFLTNFNKSLWVIVFLIGGLTMLATWLGIYQGHLPLRKLSQGMRLIGPSKLNTRFDPAEFPKELRGLVDSMNMMIERIESAYARLSNFSSDIAHELRTPLTNLITQIQVTLVKQRQSDDYRELLYSNLEELESLKRMISDLLWLAKSENGQIKPRLERLDLKIVVEDLIDFFEPLAQEKDLNIELTVKQECALLADKDLLKRALSNLISNAIKFAQKDTGIQISLKHTSNTIVLKVANEGKTIPAEALPNLFDRFYRVDPSRHKEGEGAGLGLSITQAIVEAHHGEISVSSENQVTCFTIRLPANLG